MFQENAQTSLNIAQKLPSLIKTFARRSIVPAALILDNTITDSKSTEPWFESLIRALVSTYPKAVIVSVVGGVPQFVNSSKNANTAQFYERLREVQQHYALTVVDMAQMTRVLRGESGSAQPDRLWPQADFMVDAFGTALGPRNATRVQYFAHFTPRVRKTKQANYPQNHPPWPTHQYLAAAVGHALLETMSFGCKLSFGGFFLSFSPLPIPVKTVALSLDACPICLRPLSYIDAKAPPPHASDDSPAVLFGDWNWVTDEKGRAGWQSDVAGSVLRFRLRVGPSPLIALTYLVSHETFGDFRITFRTPSDGPFSRQTFDEGPFLVLKGWASSFSLPKVAIFPAKRSLLSGSAWNLLNATILGRGANTAYLYIENISPNKSRGRVKVLSLLSC